MRYVDAIGELMGGGAGALLPSAGSGGFRPAGGIAARRSSGELGAPKPSGAVAQPQLPPPQQLSAPSPPQLRQTPQVTEPSLFAGGALSPSAAQQRLSLLRSRSTTDDAVLPPPSSARPLTTAAGGGRGGPLLAAEQQPRAFGARSLQDAFNSAAGLTVVGPAAAAGRGRALQPLQLAGAAASLPKAAEGVRPAAPPPAPQAQLAAGEKPAAEGRGQRVDGFVVRSDRGTPPQQQEEREGGATGNEAPGATPAAAAAAGKKPQPPGGDADADVPSPLTPGAPRTPRMSFSERPPLPPSPFSSPASAASTPAPAPSPEPPSPLPQAAPPDQQAAPGHDSAGAGQQLRQQQGQGLPSNLAINVPRSHHRHSGAEWRLFASGQSRCVSCVSPSSIVHPQCE